MDKQLQRRQMKYEWHKDAIVFVAALLSSKVKIRQELRLYYFLLVGEFWTH